MRGTFLGGSYNKDYSILGSILGSPYFGKLPHYCYSLSIVHYMVICFELVCNSAVRGLREHVSSLHWLGARPRKAPHLFPSWIASDMVVSQN